MDEVIQTPALDELYMLPRSEFEPTFIGVRVSDKTPKVSTTDMSVRLEKTFQKQRFWVKSCKEWQDEVSYMCEH